MYKQLSVKLGQGAKKKANMCDNHIRSYLIVTMWAGLFIGLGMISLGISSEIFSKFTVDISRITNGLIFSLALSLVMMAGGDLFTGNILVLSIGAMRKDVKYSQMIKVWIISWIGNFIGAIIFSLLILGAGFKDSSTAEVIVNIANKKASYDFSLLFFKGIMCNVLVCLAVLCCYAMESESGKLIMIVWCILPFVAMGFEHCIANMTAFTIAKILSKDFTFYMMLKNLIPVTIGNIVGGLIVSCSYYILGKEN